MFNYYAKAWAAAIIPGLTYLMSVIAPAAHLSDVSFVQWIGFAVSILGSFAGVAVITNGPKPVKEAPQPASVEWIPAVQEPNRAPATMPAVTAPASEAVVAEPARLYRPEGVPVVTQRL